MGGYFELVCDLCDRPIKRAWRYAWRPADPEPRRHLTLHWLCAHTLVDAEPKTWVYKGSPHWRLDMDVPGFKKDDQIILGETWDVAKRLSKKLREQCPREPLGSPQKD